MSSFKQGPSVNLDQVQVSKNASVGGWPLCNFMLDYLVECLCGM